MSFIRNTDKLIEGSSKLFFSNIRAKAAVQSDLDNLSSSISSEQSARQSEDSGIKLRLDVIEGGAGISGSIAKAQADAQAYADQKVAALVNSAPSVLDTLKELSDAIGGDASFAATVAGQIGSVDDKVDQEILDRQAAISSLQSSLGGDVSGLQSAIEDEESRAMLAEQTLSGRLDLLESDPVTKSYVDGEISAVESQVSGEQSRAELAESALSGRLDVLEGSGEGSVSKAEQDSKDYTDLKIGDLEDQPDVATYVGQLATSVFGQISNEATARENADMGLSNRLDILEQDPTTQTYVDGQVSDLLGEISAAATEAVNISSGYADSAVLVEKTRAESAESSLDARLDVIEGPNSVVGSIAKAEKDAKDYADSLDSAMDTRVSALESDPVTQSYVDGEVSNLQGQVNTEKGRIDAILLAADADKNSFAEIVSLINSVDTSNDQAFASYVLSNDAALAQEVLDRQSADTTLQNNINGLFASKSTSDLAEGSRLYYTQARFDSAFAAKSSSDLAEGSKLFFTDARAKSASVVNSSAGSQTDQAMSVSAAKSYIDSADGARLKLDGSVAMTGQFLAIQGTQTAPGISFTGATGYGAWYNSATPSVNLVHNGTSRLSTTSAGISVNGTMAATTVSANGITSTATLTMAAASNANMVWSTDGAGNIGAAAASRPDQVYVKTRVTTPGLTLTSFSGVLKASAGVVAGSATTSDMPEGSNQYFTDARAKSAAVVNSSAGSQTDQAMSVSAGKSYTDSAVSSEASLRSAEDLLMVKLDGSRAMSGELSMQGGMKVKHSAKSANYTILSSDYLIGVTSVSGGKVMTLPTAASVGAGKVFVIKDQSGSASPTDYIRIACQGSEQIDGQSSYDIDAAYESAMVYSNGSNWFIV